MMGRCFTECGLPMLAKMIARPSARRASARVTTSPRTAYCILRTFGAIVASFRVKLGATFDAMFSSWAVVFGDVFGLL